MVRVLPQDGLTLGLTFGFFFSQKNALYKFTVRVVFRIPANTDKHNLIGRGKRG